MPALWLASLAGLLLELAGSFVGKLIISLGISSVSYTGISFVLSNLSDFALGQLTGVSGIAGQLLSILNLDSALSMIISAITVKFTMAGLSPNGAIFRYGLKVPSKQGGLF